MVLAIPLRQESFGSTDKEMFQVKSTHMLESHFVDQEPGALAESAAYLNAFFTGTFPVNRNHLATSRF